MWFYCTTFYLNYLVLLFYIPLWHLPSLKTVFYKNSLDLGLLATALQLF